MEKEIKDKKIRCRVEWTAWKPDVWESFALRNHHSNKWSFLSHKRISMNQKLRNAHHDETFVEIMKLTHKHNKNFTPHCKVLQRRVLFLYAPSFLLTIALLPFLYFLFPSLPPFLPLSFFPSFLSEWKKKRPLREQRERRLRLKLYTNHMPNRSPSPEAFSMTLLSIRKGNKKNKTDLWGSVSFAYRNWNRFVPRLSNRSEKWWCLKIRSEWGVYLPVVSGCTLFKLCCVLSHSVVSNSLWPRGL